MTRRRDHARARNGATSLVPTLFLRGEALTLRKPDYFTEILREILRMRERIFSPAPQKMRRLPWDLAHKQSGMGSLASTMLDPKLHTSNLKYCWLRLYPVSLWLVEECVYIYISTTHVATVNTLQVWHHFCQINWR